MKWGGNSIYGGRSISSSKEPVHCTDLTLYIISSTFVSVLTSKDRAKDMLPVVIYALSSAALAAACDPTTTTSCPAIPAMPSTVTYALSTTNTADFSYVMSDRISANGSALNFSVAEQGDAPTIITNDYLLYGNVKATIQSAPGTGMVSAFILMSDVLDEIDLEWLGAYDNQVQTNYYYRGETAGYDRGGVTTVATPENTTHVYEIDWTNTTLSWSVDGVVVRTLNQVDTTGYGYPSTPCQIKIGVWASGDPSNAAGTIEWGGGLINYAAGPYTMTLSSLEVTSYTTAKSFSYTNNGTDVLISQSEASASAVSGSFAATSASPSATSTQTGAAIDGAKPATAITTSSSKAQSITTRTALTTQSGQTITAASTTLSKATNSVSPKSASTSQGTTSASTGSLASTSSSPVSSDAQALRYFSSLSLVSFIVALAVTCY